MKLQHNKKLFCFLIIYRIVNSVLLQTIFEPDEIWQNVEPIFYLLFQKGEPTWDWKTGIRSYINIMPYLMPHFLFYKFFSSYKTFGYYITKIINGLLAGACDIYTIKIAILKGVSCANILFIVLFSHGLWLYSPRSHINSLEMMLCVIIAYIYELKKKYKKNNYALIVALSTVCLYIRPTSLFFTVPLLLADTLNMLKYIPVSIGLIILMIIIDSFLYGEFVFPCYNFYLINIKYGVGNLFGKLPWFSHLLFIHILTGFLPIFLIFNQIKNLFGIKKSTTVKILRDFEEKLDARQKKKSLKRKTTNLNIQEKERSSRRRKNNFLKSFILKTLNILKKFMLLSYRWSIYILYLPFFSLNNHKKLSILFFNTVNAYRKVSLQISCMFYIFCYSIIPHKEMRFMLTTVPFILIFCSRYKLSSLFQKIYVIIFILCVFIGYNHQAYFKTLSHIKNMPSKHLRILYCVCPYSLPAYSFFCNKNWTIDYISGNPNIYEKCMKLKIYKTFGVDIEVDKYKNFMKGNFVPDFDPYNVVLLYERDIRRFENRLHNFSISYKQRYSFLGNEEEKSQIICVFVKK